MLQRIARRGGPAVHVEFPVDRAEVSVDGANADHQALRHLRVGEALAHQREHLDLAGGQALGGIGAGIRARRGHEFHGGTNGSPRTFLPRRREAASPNALRVSASTRS
jgi:hypothetical protein